MLEFQINIFNVQIILPKLTYFLRYDYFIKLKEKYVQYYICLIKGIVNVISREHLIKENINDLQILHFETDPSI